MLLDVCITFSRKLSNFHFVKSWLYFHIHKGFWALSYIHLKNDIDLIQPYKSSSTFVCNISSSVWWKFLLKIVKCDLACDKDFIILKFLHEVWREWMHPWIRRESTIISCVPFSLSYSLYFSRICFTPLSAFSWKKTSCQIYSKQKKNHTLTILTQNHL